MKRLVQLLVLFTPLILASPVQAQQQPAGGRGGRGGAPPEPPKNLQILPKDIARPELIATMGAFARGLGVQCSYCHIEPETDGREDRAADDKAPKKTARVMMKMTMDLNTRLGTEVGKPASELTRVQCVTCHRGVAIPKQLSEILVATDTQKGAPAAIEQWRDLRKQYYGAMAYDFSDAGLAGVAQQLVAANKPDDALALLQVNLEFFPRSAPTYAGMAAAYTRKNDRQNAIKSFEKVLEIDPKNQNAQRQLDQLKAQP
jgi:hypothetical protein